MSDHYYSQTQSSKHELKKVPLEFQKEKFSFWTDSGVFSKDRVDPGTLLLLKALVVNPGDTFLDLGCGWGVVGIVVGRFVNDALIHMVDINERACETARMNLRENKIENASVICSDGLTSYPLSYFDCIATNPPIRLGKASIYQMASDSYEKLKNGGRYYAVIKTSHGANSFAKHLTEVFGNCETVEIKGGYRVLHSIKK